MMLKKPNPHLDEDADFELGPADGDLEWERRMQKYYGLRPKPYTLARCPRIVAGKRCLLGNPHGRCICQSTPSHLWDHRRMWRDAIGRTVLTLEPYGIDGEEFTTMAGELVALGLEILVEGYSPYYPGHSVLIIIRRPVDPPRFA